MPARPHESGPAWLRRLRTPPVIVIAILVAAFAAHLLRQSGHPSWDTVWAEDGPVYARDALAMPAPSTLLRPYAGYAQFLPRVLALAMRVLPISLEAVYFAVVASLIWALLTVFVYRHTEHWLHSTALRLLVCATYVAAPSAGYEVGANLANLGWPLLFASFWAVMSRRASRLDVGTSAVVVALSALTTPLTAVFLPWSIVRVVRERARRDVIVAGAMVSALAIQAIPVLTAPVGSVRGGAHARYLPLEYGQRVIGSVVLGERWLSTAWERYGTTVVWVAIAGIACLVALCRPWRIERRYLWFAASAAFLSVVLFMFPVWNRDAGQLRPLAGTFDNAGSRYVVVPALLLLTAIVVVVDRSRRRGLPQAVVVYGLVLVVASYSVGNPRSLGPSWSTEVRAKKDVCAKTHEPAVAVPITPSAGGWLEVVPCDRLLP